MATKIQPRKVKSSNIATLAYDGQHRQLWVCFRSGHAGYYQAVPESKFHALIEANAKKQSVGKLLHATVKGQHAWVQTESPKRKV